MRINEVIHAKRKALNMTQMQLAEKLDVSDKTVSRWELGTIYPNVDMLPKIAVVLGISINELFGDSGKVDEPINNNEKRDYNKITFFKVFLYILIICSIISLILFFIGIKISEESSKISSILIICSCIIFALSSIAFYINRMFFAAFYKEKFYISEYKRLDAKITTTANFLNCYMISGVFLFSPRFIIVELAIFSIVFMVNYFFLKKLDYHYNKGSLIPLILAIIIFIGFLALSIYSMIGHPNIVIIPCLIASGIMNLLTCISFVFFTKNKNM